MNSLSRTIVCRKAQTFGNATTETEITITSTEGKWDDLMDTLVKAVTKVRVVDLIMAELGKEDISKKLGLDLKTLWDKEEVN